MSKYICPNCKKEQSKVYISQDFNESRLYDFPKQEWELTDKDPVNRGKYFCPGCNKQIKSQAMIEEICDILTSLTRMHEV